jgi:putative phosphoesterase
MKIGLISDTHNHLPAAVFDIFNGVDQILHAGDIGSEDILTQLGSIAPVKAVYGNIDTFPLVSRLKQIDFIRVAEIEICLIHIIGSPRVFYYQLFKMNRKVHAVIYGHTHIPGDLEYQGVHFINPGSAAYPKGEECRSVALMHITGENFRTEIICL